ncbi:hypothetical protein ANTRET_LOCUS10824 [Anthophora retusa]
MSILDRLIKLNLPHAKESNVHQAVFLAGPSGVGKTGLLMSLATMTDIDPLLPNVSRINYQLLTSDKYGLTEDRANEYLCTKRNDDMIYEHTNQCGLLHKIVNKYIARYRKDDDDPDDHLRKLSLDLFAECRSMQNHQSTQRIVLLLDIRASHFAVAAKPRAYFETIAYLSMLSEHHLYPFVRAFVLFDRNQIDPNLQSVGIYKLVRELSTSKRRKILFVEDLDEVRRFLLDAHLRRPLSDAEEV